MLKYSSKQPKSTKKHRPVVAANSNCGTHLHIKPNTCRRSGDTNLKANNESGETSNTITCQETPDSSKVNFAKEQR
ncbi:hypothetical protein PoB_003105600 [Plakobranchus ocellatus]|uniref:Uncharacterized protein n=1 Tax=Plakobranchus ocellatus TaxID=259542 RepID=A0AAV4A8D3_9GAST|nr:hypothetical protein PoB_003105600 [Plakobranchus ocellatus]